MVLNVFIEKNLTETPAGHPKYQKTRRFGPKARWSGPSWPKRPPFM